MIICFISIQPRLRISDGIRYAPPLTVGDIVTAVEVGSAVVAYVGLYIGVGEDVGESVVGLMTGVGNIVDGVGPFVSGMGVAVALSTTGGFEVGPLEASVFR